MSRRKRLARARRFWTTGSTGRRQVHTAPAGPSSYPRTRRGNRNHRARPISSPSLGPGRRIWLAVDPPAWTRLCPSLCHCVQASVDSSNSRQIEVYLGKNIAPDFFAWLVPTTDGQALAGLSTRRTAQVYFSEFLQRLRQENRITRVASGPGIWGIPLRPFKRVHLDRVLVVGDAAGQVKPMTGGGIYYALLSSEMAAQTLGEALDSDD